MREPHRRSRSYGNEWAKCQGQNSVMHEQTRTLDEPTVKFDWASVNGPNTVPEEDEGPITEDTFRSVEAAFILGQDDAKELLNRPTVGGLGWVIYRILTGDPKWDAATTIEALREAIKKLYRNHVFP